MRMIATTGNEREVRFFLKEHEYYHCGVKLTYFEQRARNAAASCAFPHEKKKDIMKYYFELLATYEEELQCRGRK